MLVVHNIPLRNCEGNIIKFSKVDPEDYTKFSKYSWQCKKDGYVCGRYDGKTQSLHRAIMGPIPDGFDKIDHIDNDKLNNTRGNLRFVTNSQNSQNKGKRDGTSSVYIGVHWSKKAQKWEANSGGIFLGYHKYAKDAAKKYDTYVLLKFGELGRTNNLVFFEDVQVQDLSLESMLAKKQKIGDLPCGISKSGPNRFRVMLTYNKNIYSQLVSSLEEANAQLAEFKRDIESLKNEERLRQFSKPILCNEKGQAIMEIKNIIDEVIDTTIVPHDRWHELTQWRWSKTHDKYYKGSADGKEVRLHRYLMNAKPGEIVDHINKNGDTTNNNSMENLRLITHSANAHNKIKKLNTSSQFIGVSLTRPGKWRACISGMKLGTYPVEVQAAIAYNIKARAIHGEFARTNEVSTDDMDLYEKIILEKLTNENKM